MLEHASVGIKQPSLAPVNLRIKENFNCMEYHMSHLFPMVDEPFCYRGISAMLGHVFDSGECLGDIFAWSP